MRCCTGQPQHQGLSPSIPALDLLQRKHTYSQQTQAINYLIYMLQLSTLLPKVAMTILKRMHTGDSQLRQLFAALVMPTHTKVPKSQPLRAAQGPLLCPSHEPWHYKGCSSRMHAERRDHKVKQGTAAAMCTDLNYM